jgi:hypothetical protein
MRVPTFATKAPSLTNGQSAGPPSSKAASAIPVGAQTVVTCSATNATREPSRAASTYATAISAMSRSVV